MKRRSVARSFLRLTALLVVGALISSITASARPGGNAPGGLRGDLGGNSVQNDGGGRQEPEGFRVHLRGRSFEPQPGADRAGILGGRSHTLGDRLHFYVQMDPLPDAAARDDLAQHGLRLLNYVSGDTYIASAAAGDLDSIASLPGVRWIGPIDAADKIPTAVARERLAPWSQSGGRLILAVSFHADVSMDDAVAVVRAFGGQVLGTAPLISTVTASFARGRARQLAAADPVQFVDAVTPPQKPKNDSSRLVTNQGVAAAAPYNDTGKGVIGLVYDAGVAAAHTDFGSRLIETNSSTIGAHATHVTGTFAGSGAASAANGGTANQWAGYAPGAKIRSYVNTVTTDALYDDPGTTESDLKQAMQSTVGGKGIDLATASLGDTADPARGCTVLGDYVNTSILLDKIVRGGINDADGNPQKLIWTFAAGNERVLYANTPPAGPIPCGDFSTLSSPAPAKDVITVGAVNSDDRGVAVFSSWGPTNDGRLKPDVSAPGCNTTRTAIMSTVGTNGYKQMCGTSMATPAVAGTIALMIEEWRKNHADSRPLPSTVKAVLVHTAQATGVSDYLITGSGSSGIMWTATQIAGGNTFSIAYVKPAAPNQPLSGTATSVATGGTAITINLATDAAGNVTSTAQDVVTYANNNVLNAAGTNALVRAALAFGGNPAAAFGGNTGTGVVVPMAATNLGNGSAAKTGPDYRYGWGTIDAGAAVKLIADDGKGEQIDVEKVDQGKTQTMQIYSDGSQDFKATLAWDDPPGTRLAANELVNDLDLTLVDPSGAVYHPLVLDPTNPLAAPTQGTDTHNNVEEAIGTKKAGMWQVVVTGSHVPSGPQEYSLITPPKGNSVHVTSSVVTEGDSGTHPATFVVTLNHPDDAAQTVSYTTVDGTASSGADYAAAAGTLTFAPGETEKLVPVTVNGDTDAEPDETYTFNVSQGADVVASGSGTIVDDDSARQFRVVGKTGQSSLAGIDPRSVNINDKGQVVFVGYHQPNVTNGNSSIWVADPGAQAQSVNPSWGGDSLRLFSYPTILNDGSVIVEDREAGAPPYYFVRKWTKPLVFGEWNHDDIVTSVQNGGPFDAMVTPTASLNNAYVTFVGISLGASGTTINWGPQGNDGAWTNITAPHPLVADDGATVFRQVRDGDYHNAPIEVVNVYAQGTGKIACPAGGVCAHPGFTDVGWLPGISNDGSVVSWFGVQDPVAPSTTSTPGIWASVKSGTSRLLVKVAGIGDAGITDFTQADRDGRIGVNATQDKQHGVTIVFTATANGKQGLYKAQIGYVGPTDAPTALKVIGPTLVVRAGQNVDGVGTIDSITLGNHPINSHNAGDIAFYVHAGSTDAALVADSPDTPLLFVPGIAGSKLVDLASGDSVWMIGLGNFLGRDSYWSKALSLRDEDQQGRNIVATDAMRTALGPFVDIYKGFLNSLGSAGYKAYNLGTNGENVRTCDMSQWQARPNLFVFPYDWRQSNTVNAANLANYMTCIQRFYPGTKVNVVTHSMGGLLTRRTVLTQPGFADDINSWTAIAPPWLGAPKLIYVLRSGDFIPTVASGPGVERAAAALTAAQQLMPSRAGISLAGVPVYGEQGRDFDNNGTDTEGYATFDRMKDVLDKAFPRFKPGTTAGKFHDTPGQDDWSADTYPYKFYEIYGVQNANETIGQVFETTKTICDQAAASTPNTSNASPSATCKTSHPLRLTYTSGDGTVPTWSAARVSGMQPPGATIDPPVHGGSDASHNGILGNPTVQTRVKGILTDNGGPPDPNASHARMIRVNALKRTATEHTTLQVAKAADVTPPPPPATLRSITVYGESGFAAKDDAGHSTAVTENEDGDVLENPIPDSDTYVLGDDAQSIRTTSTSPITVDFTADGPVEVDLTTEDGNGTVTDATRFLDVGLAPGTAAEITAVSGSTPTLRYDSNGDGTIDASAAVDVHVTGTAAQDTQPPTISVTHTLADDGMLDVSASATDTGSGVSVIRYTLDGETWNLYQGPFRVNPTDDLDLQVLAQDVAGNTAVTDKIAVGAVETQRPVPPAVSAITDEDTPVDIELGPTTSHGRTLTYKVSQQPANGTVTISGAIAHYVPEPDYNGTDSFRYTVDDGLLRSDPSELDLTIRAVNDAPRATLSGPGSVPEGSSGSAFTATATDPEGDPITYSWSASGGTIAGSGGNATLKVGDGPDTITVTLVAKDPSGASVTVTRDVSVSNVAPTVDAGSAKAGYWGQALSFSGTISDASSADTAAGFTSSWSFGDRTPNAPTRVATHTYAAAGSYSATFKATDKDGGTGSDAVAVTVKQRTTSVTYTGSNGTVPYGYAKLSAKLSDLVDPATASLANRKVMFTVGFQTYVGTTDASGAATVVLPSPLAPGSYAVSAKFAGDTAYGSSISAPASLKVGSSIGSVTGSGLVSASNGAHASFSVSSTDGTSVRGTLSYVDSTTSVTAMSLTPLGIAPDGHSAWFAGVTATGVPIRVYVEDRGTGPLNGTFQIWLNGTLRNGSGALSAGEVTIAH